jgi:hypothetical protein
LSGSGDGPAHLRGGVRQPTHRGLEAHPGHFAAQHVGNVAWRGPDRPWLAAGDATAFTRDDQVGWVCADVCPARALSVLADTARLPVLGCRHPKPVMIMVQRAAGYTAACVLRLRDAARTVRQDPRIKALVTSTAIR